MYLKYEVLSRAAEEKMDSMPANTAMNHEQSLVNFDKFCKEKYKDSALDVCKELVKETDIKVPCAILQSWITWSVKRRYAPSTIKTRFWFIKDFMYDKGIEISNIQVRKNITLPKNNKEEMYPLSKDELRKIVDVASLKRKSLYLVQSSTGCRIGELLQVRKKDIVTSSKRWIIKLRADTTKTKVARSTFMSKEAMKYTKQLLDAKNDSDVMWATNPEMNKAQAAEQHALRGYLRQTKLEMRYETGIRKITSHSMRAYYATQAVRVHGENYMNKMIGHAGYLMEYDRYEEDEKLKMYLALEPSLLVYEDHSKDVEDLKKENLEIKKKLKKLEGLIFNPDDFNDVREY